MQVPSLGSKFSFLFMVKNAAFNENAKAAPYQGNLITGVRPGVRSVIIWAPGRRIISPWAKVSVSTKRYSKAFKQNFQREFQEKEPSLAYWTEEAKTRHKTNQDSVAVRGIWGESF